MNENGYCRHCGLDFDGGDIVQTFVDQGKTKEEAEEIGGFYGYGPDRTKWGKDIGIYCLERDRTINRQCPECKGLQNET